jgi:hypothetical protein
MEKNYFASLKALKKGVGSGIGSGSSSQMYGSADPDPHQNVMDPQHCFFCMITDGFQNFLLFFLVKNIKNKVSAGFY